MNGDVYDRERLLLTGASGFVGGLLAARLEEVAPWLSILPVRGPASDGGPFQTLRSIDLANADSASRLISEFQPTMIVHLAARSSIKEGSQEPIEVWRSNFDATRNLAFAAKAHAARSGSRVRLIFASSSEVYGAAFSSGPCGESSPIAPITAYGHAKAASEFLLKDIAGDELAITILRLFNHTGPGQDVRFVVPSLIKQVAKLELGRPGTVVVGDLASERDFTDVRDIVEAYLKVILAPRGDVKTYSIYNVGSGVVRSIQSILDELTVLHGAAIVPLARSELFRNSDLRRTEGLFDLFSSRFSWRPRHNFNSTIAEMLDYERTASIVRPTND